MIRFANAVESFRTSEIRDLMSVAIRPDVISFAGGMPGNDLFPIEDIEEVYSSLSLSEKQAAFQYGPTPGYPQLLESLKEYLRQKGFDVENNKLLITTGSLQALYILAKIFVNPGDTVITENPAFIGALSAFRSFQAHLYGIELRADGINTDELRHFLATSAKEQIKFLYLTPNFHNPAGTLYSAACRHEVAAIAKEFELTIVEDDAYGELYFEPTLREKVTPIKILHERDCTICYTGSFSKILGPGFRLGWLLAPPDVYKYAELCKQSIDACSPNYTQVLADAFLEGVEGVVALADHQAADAGVFVGHAHAAVIPGPGSAISGVELIEDFAREIRPAELVEPLGVVLAEPVHLLFLFGGQVGVVGGGARREEVS